jgi:hypothetical protein
VTDAVHQFSLRATLDWSHAMLNEAERHAFAACGAFADGAPVDAYEAVTGASLDTLQCLIDRCLLFRREDRLAMLELTASTPPSACATFTTRTRSVVATPSGVSRWRPVPMWHCGGPIDEIGCGAWTPSPPTSALLLLGLSAARERCSVASWRS